MGSLVYLVDLCPLFCRKLWWSDLKRSAGVGPESYPDVGRGTRGHNFWKNIISMLKCWSTYCVLTHYCQVILVATILFTHWSIALVSLANPCWIIKWKWNILLGNLNMNFSTQNAQQFGNVLHFSWNMWQLSLERFSNSLMQIRTHDLPFVSRVSFAHSLWFLNFTRPSFLFLFEKRSLHRKLKCV